jgi:hypothetical protein
MSIFISNSAYLAKAALADCLPIIAWQSTLQFADITVSGFEGLRVPGNLWGPDTATFWQPPAGSSSSITLANPLGLSVDYVAIAKHNLGSAAISYTLSSSPDGVTFTPFVSDRSVVGDSPIVEFFNPSVAPYFKIEFSGGVPIIAHVRMGAALVLPQSIYVGHAPANIAKVVERVSQKSRNGQYLGQVVTCTSYKSSLKQENIDPLFIRQKIAPFIAHAQSSRQDDGTASGTFFFAWRPVDYADEVIYAWTESDIHPENQRVNGMMSFNFDMNAVG